jgi:AcrR family transcriptional regulator
MSSEKGRDLIWSRPEPAERRPRFSRRQIAATALAIADAEGFEAVSMRRIAAELGAGTMTLYHYVRNKEELVALMDDAHMAESLVPEGELPEDWRAALTVIARRTRAALMRHPWALHALQAAQFGPNAMRHFEQSLAALDHTPLDAGAKFTVLAIVDDYVFGNVLRAGEVFARRQAARDTPPEEVEAIMAYAMSEIRTGRYPQLQALMGDVGPAQTPVPEEVAADMYDPDAGFEEGLEALLDGIARRFGLAASGADGSGQGGPG